MTHEIASGGNDLGVAAASAKRFHDAGVEASLEPQCLRRRSHVRPKSHRGASTVACGPSSLINDLHHEIHDVPLSMDLDIAAAQPATLGRPARHRDGECIVPAGLAVIRDVDGEGA